MPIFIEEVSAEVSQTVVPQVESQPLEGRVTVVQPQFEFLQTLNLLEERKQRLEFD
jgi:hypothetical protein